MKNAQIGLRPAGRRMSNTSFAARWAGTNCVVARAGGRLYPRRSEVDQVGPEGHRVLNLRNRSAGAEFVSSRLWLARKRRIDLRGAGTLPPGAFLRDLDRLREAV